MTFLKRNSGKIKLIVFLVITVFLFYRCDQSNKLELEQKKDRAEAALQQELQIFTPFLDKYKELNAQYHSRNERYQHTLDYQNAYLQTEQKYHLDFFQIEDIQSKEDQFIYTLEKTYTWWSNQTAFFKLSCNINPSTMNINRRTKIGVIFAIDKINSSFHEQQYDSGNESIIESYTILTGTCLEIAKLDIPTFEKLRYVNIELFPPPFTNNL